MNRLKKKTKRNVLFLTATAIIFSVPGFGMGTTVYADLAAFDIDANGELDGGTDALLFSRYDTAVEQNCTRYTASTIEAHLPERTASSSDEDTFANGLGMTFKRIPAGTFTMGSPTDELERGDDGTQYEVTLTQAFYIQTTEVTQGQWKAIMGSNPSGFSECGDNCPVEQVSWDDAQEFITKMNERGEGTYRLPTEAEWEYAARGGSKTAFANGGITETGTNLNLYAIGWYWGNSGETYSGCYDGSRRDNPSCAGTHPVAQKQANAYGLHDMHGNVYEWCGDWYGDYPTGSVTDPTGPDAGSYRVSRGGGWYYSAGNCRSAHRSRCSPGYRRNTIGLRLVLSPGQ